MLKRYGLRMALAAMAAVAVSIGVILVSLLSGTSKLIEEMLLRQSEVANHAFAQTIDGYQVQALERAAMIASTSDIVNAVANKDSEALVNSLKVLSAGFDLVTLCDADGVVLARSHSDKTGDSVINQQAIATALSTGTGISTIEPGTVIGLSTRGSAAIKDGNGNIIGALTCGHDLSLPKYVDAIKSQNNCEATLFAGDERMNTTLLNESGGRAVGTKAGDAVIEAVLNNEQDYHLRLDLFGSAYEGYYSPLIINGKTIGMLFTGVHVEDAIIQERNMLTLILIAVVLLLTVMTIAAMIIRWITNKIHWFEGILDSIPFPISVTDMDMNWTFINKPVEQMLNVRRADMLGKHCSTWKAGICGTANCGITCLRGGKTATNFEQAGMDFQVDIGYLLDAKQKHIGHIEVVQDITERVRTQKSEAMLVRKISELSKGFVSASQNIADGASELAQNSMEQAVAVQQLSESVSDMAGKTRDNALLAGKAAQLAEEIRRNAEKGSSQMDKMTQAVQEINLSSHSISKVMKAIDDIAFQTNILALNAAVEAARAGQHGKGFAVVADEVRNLAAKSAEAANETGTLISNSIEKAELGVHIAAETEASLKGIVSGIGESSRIVKEIAVASDYQSEAIEEINRKINQVSEGVQQNSATAQESAAHSEEVSGQSAYLQQLVNDFGSKGDKNETGFSLN